MFMTMAIARMSMPTKSENKDKSVICSFVGFFVCVPSVSPDDDMVRSRKYCIQSQKNNKDNREVTKSQNSCAIMGLLK